jgi:Ni2+-binding GTPase involved in maturation of urease and hydrogenase
VAQSNITILRQLASEGIMLRKYPKSENFNIRCLIIDKNDITYQKLITYEKFFSDTININQKYSVMIYEKNDDKYLIVIKYLLSILSYKNENRVLVGFSGTNNVGKTTIAKSVYGELKKYYKVTMIEDIFRKTGQKTERNDNINALLKQLNEIFDAQSEIILVDHTPLDTLAFIRLFDKDMYNALYAEVISIMHRFDCLFNICIKNDKFDFDSTLVDKKARKNVYMTINEIYRNNNIPYL